MFKTMVALDTSNVAVWMAAVRRVLKSQVLGWLLQDTETEVIAETMWEKDMTAI